MYNAVKRKIVIYSARLATNPALAAGMRDRLTIMHNASYLLIYTNLKIFKSFVPRLVIQVYSENSASWDGIQS